MSLELKRYPARYLTVKGCEQKGPQLVTIELMAESFSDIPVNLLGKHIKVIIPDEKFELLLPQEKEGELEWPGEKHHLKTYTIAKHEDNCIEIDVCLHDRGQASRWARKVQTGQRVGMLGPKVKPSEDFNFNEREFFFISDLTGVGTLRSLFQRIPKNSKGECFIHLESKNDVFTFNPPENFNVHWIVSDSYGQGVKHNLNQIDYNQYSNLSVYLIGKSPCVKEIESSLREIPTLNQENFFSQGYWK